MKTTLLGSIAITALLVMAAPLKAHELKADHELKTENHIHVAETDIVPDAERKYAREKEFEGPKKTEGIEKVRLLGTVPLAGQFKDPAKQKLRAREIDIKPGGVVAVHRHDGRPGVAYMVKGQLTEHRQGAKAPVVKKAGDTAFEKTGVTHWWRNDGDTVARIIVVDLVPLDLK